MSTAVSAASGWFFHVGGSDEVHVRPFPAGEGKWQVSIDGGDSPLWRPDGRELAYRRGEAVMAATITPGPSLSFGRPQVLYRGNYIATVTRYPDYDVAPDGRRFLMIRRRDLPTTPEVHVLVNAAVP